MEDFDEMFAVNVRSEHPQQESALIHDARSLC